MLVPERAGPLILSVGGRETDEFRRQQEVYAEAWHGAGPRHLWNMVDFASILARKSLKRGSLTRAMTRALGDRHAAKCRRFA